MAHKNEIINPLNQVLENMYINMGIKIIKGKASLVDNHTVEVNGNNYTAENIVISTVQRPQRLNISGKEYLHSSSDLLFEENFPKRITFIGAGIISLEFAAMATKLGSEVNVIEFSNRALRQYHGEYVDKIIEKFKNEGVNFYFNEAVSEVQKNGDEAADLINIFTIIINQKMRKTEIEKMILAFPATTWGIFVFFLQNILVD